MAMAKVKVLGLAAGAAILVATAAWAQHDMKHDGSMHGGHHGDARPRLLGIHMTLAQTRESL